LLRDHLPGLLENVDSATRQRMWFQQDAPPHNALIVRDFLNNHYNNRWIGVASLLTRPHIARLLFVGILEKCCFRSTDYNKGRYDGMNS